MYWDTRCGGLCIPLNTAVGGILLLKGDVWHTAALTTLKDYKDNVVYKVIYLVSLHGPLITESYTLYTYGTGRTTIKTM